MQKPDFFVVNPKAQGAEPFALVSSDFIVDCLMMNFKPEEREAVLRFAICDPYPDQPDREAIVCQIMTLVRAREQAER